jgi:hypothetical protein
MGMKERSNAQVGALVRKQMRACGMTELRLREAAKVDRKTLLGLLDGTRWPQEETRLRMEIALGWAPGSIQEVREGNAPTLAESEPESPLWTATDDELVEEVRRRLLVARHSGGGSSPLNDPQIPGPGTPPGWRHSAGDESGMLG